MELFYIYNNKAKRIEVGGFKDKKSAKVKRNELN